MTLLQKLKFDFLRRRALFVTNNRAQIFHWNGGELEGIYSFDSSAQGLALFDDYLRENHEEPIYLLTDIPDEEFRLDTIPHVMGSDKKALLERKQAKLFRDIKYSYSLIQGRESEGRRDDKVVFSALTEDEAIQPWLDRLAAFKTPVAGIYSVAHVTKYLLKSLGHGSGPALVVSVQRNAGLRITFFYNNDFRFSRLVRLPRYGTEPYAPIIIEEIEKMLRYLRSMRQINQDTVTNVYILGNADLLNDVDYSASDNVGLKYHSVALQDVASKLGMKHEFVDPYAESLFVYVVLRQRPGNIYATETETRYYNLRRVRHALLSFSLLLLLGSFAWSGYAFVSGITLKQETINARAKTEFYSERFKMAQERLPNVPVEPDKLKTAVQVVQEMSKYRATPQPMMSTVSDVLEKYPGLQIKSMHWYTSTDPNYKPNANTANNQNAGNIQPDDDYIYYQIAEIDGFIESFNGNYRAAIDVVNRFAEELRLVSEIHHVRILSMPLDVSPEARLEGSSESVVDEATYSLRVVLGVSHEA